MCFAHSRGNGPQKPLAIRIPLNEEAGTRATLRFTPKPVFLPSAYVVRSTEESDVPGPGH